MWLGRLIVGSLHSRATFDPRLFHVRIVRQVLSKVLQLPNICIIPLVASLNNKLKKDVKVFLWFF